MVTFSPPPTWRHRLLTLVNILRRDRTIVRPPPDADASRRLVRLAHESSNDHAAFQAELNQLHKAGYTPQLVFLDTGLVAELGDEDRANFLDLFRAVAVLDGYHAGELMVERSRDPATVIKPEAFCLQMESLLQRIKSRTLSLAKVQIAAVLGEVQDMVRTHHVKLAGEFANVFVSVLILEGLGRQLDPDLDFLRVAVPLLREVGRQGGGRGLLKDVRPNPREFGWLLNLWLWIEAIEWMHVAWGEREKLHPSVLYLPDLLLQWRAVLLLNRVLRVTLVVCQV